MQKKVFFIIILSTFVSTCDISEIIGSIFNVEKKTIVKLFAFFGEFLFEIVL